MPASAQATVKIKNRLGLHARPAMVFVDAANHFTSSIKVKRADSGEGGESVDGKSIMDIMMLAATQGTELEVTAEGEDAQAAVERLKTLVESGFDED